MMRYSVGTCKVCGKPVVEVHTMQLDWYEHKDGMPLCGGRNRTPNGITALS